MQYLPCVPQLRSVANHNLRFWWSCWPMKELPSPKILCQWQRLTCNPVQTKSAASSPCLMPSVIIEARWLVIDILRCSETSFPTLRPDHFISWRQNQQQKFSLGKKWGFYFRDSSGHSTSECFSLVSSETLLHSTGVSWIVSDFFLPIFLAVLDTMETEILFFCASLVIFWHGLFSNASLMASWLITWGLSDRGQSFRDWGLQTIFHPKTLIMLTFICFKISIFWSSWVSKGIFQFV